MRLTPFRLFALILLLLIGGTFLGGSALWSMLGLTDDLAIEGESQPVRTATESEGIGWSAYGQDGKGTRFSAVDQITQENVDGLEIAWHFRTGSLQGREAVRSRTAFQTTPILVEDQLIFCSQFNEVFSLNPATGEENWRFDPGIPIDGRPANQFTCRGVSYWRDEVAAPETSCASRLFMGTIDARLLSLDARTGEPCQEFGQELGQEFGEGGYVQVEPSLQLRWPGEFQITSAPAIIADTVVTGSAIGDNLRTDAPLGTVHAFDARSGALKWHFNPVPRDPSDPARETWAGESADVTGHANAWSTLSVDEARGMVFVPTSSPSPDYYGGNRIGDNRYANSVVALSADTGEVMWHFQTVHHDLWDYDVPAQPGLYTVWRDGTAHDVVAQVTKTGLIFVLDRDTGVPFLPVEERPVPQGGVEGEVLSPTQPFPIATPAVVPDTLSPGDAFGVTIWDKTACANKIKRLRAEGLFTPPTEQGTLAYPFTGGGGNWGSAAYDPTRNLLVVNMSNVASYVKLTRKIGDETDVTAIEDGAETAPMEGAPYVMERAPLLSPLGLPCSPPPWGVLAGIDLSSGEIIWRRAHGTTEDLAPGGIALPFGTPTIGGPIITGGDLIFIGAALDDYLRAFSVVDGTELWKARLPAGPQATPMTYEFDGRQYVVIAAGGHGSAGTRKGDHVIAFALPNAE